ncbi:cation diffusion facilitator family transporter [Sphingomonas glacialis]|uniref:Cation transporter n=1 Tax=Sphingomonas glacialis TaxID=658225 RepID=A0A502G3J8_9SPHN|nr:cation diffusion facilitator family transporter [Sphingomonas glacialis]TPG56141.1 cation transporter [Sphingomonas glacialis]
MAGHSHNHGHSHGHSHGGGHSHAGHDHGPPAEGHDRAFAIGITLNLAFIVGEVVFGLIAGSVALLADAGHNLSDVLGLCAAWAAIALGRRAASKRFTYGLKGSTILAALLNALLLLVALGAIVLEAVQRIAVPAPVDGPTVAWVAGAGILVNGATALLFMRGRKGDLNIRGAYLHMLSDAMVSAGVVVSGLVIWLSGATWIDPIVSIVIAVLIFLQTWGLLRESVEMALAAVPRSIDSDEVWEELRELPGVARVHHVHIWPMSTTETVLTAHLVMPDGHPGDAFLDSARAMLKKRFGIGHATLQVELVGAEAQTAKSGCQPPPPLSA